MRIIGLEKNYEPRKEKFLGVAQDVLVGEKQSLTTIIFPGFWGNEIHKTKEFIPKLYLHIVRDRWTTFTAALREHLLFWRWKAAYLDYENGQKPVRVLVCAENTKIKSRCSSLFTASLNERYTKIFKQEYLCAENVAPMHRTTISHPLGAWYGTHTLYDTNALYPIYRNRGFFSAIGYKLRKSFARSWVEISISTHLATEKILIQKKDLYPIWKQFGLEKTMFGRNGTAFEVAWKKGQDFGKEQQQQLLELFTRSFLTSYRRANSYADKTDDEIKAILEKYFRNSIVPCFNSKSPYLFLVAKQGTQWAGYAQFEKLDENTAYLAELAVEPEHWRQSLGGKLIFSISHVEPDIKKIVLITERINTETHRFYEALGFVPSTYQRKEYNSPDYKSYEKILEKSRT